MRKCHHLAKPEGVCFFHGFFQKDGEPVAIVENSYGQIREWAAVNLVFDEDAPADKGSRQAQPITMQGTPPEEPAAPVA